MSRSRKRTPITGVACAESEKMDKRFANRRLRRRAHEAVREGLETLPLLREVSDRWSMAKDGRRYYKPTDRTWKGEPIDFRRIVAK